MTLIALLSIQSFEQTDREVGSSVVVIFVGASEVCAKTFAAHQSLA